MGCLRGLSFASAGLHLLMSIAAASFFIFVCVHYKNEDASDDKLKNIVRMRDVPRWLYIVLAIETSIGILTSIVGILGTYRQQYTLFHYFLPNMSFINIFLVISAIVQAVHHIEKKSSADFIAKLFFLNITYTIISVVLLVPCFMYYKKLSGRSYFEEYFGSLYCCKSTHKPAAVPQYAP